ncbi:hypothetical protein NEOLEDRAFT_1079022, partial [Neolentinus lepideus HHB14362 ss-1]
RLTSSTRNTRIERLWVEVGSQFGRQWHAFFTRLERLHRLDPKDAGHLWLLHTLFLINIRDDCAKFQQDWNHHLISGEADQTPADLRFLGQLEHGVYDDDFRDVHPDVLNQYYGADSAHEVAHPEHSGAGHSDAEEENLEDRIAHEQERHIRHEPIAVPLATSPFPPQVTAAFLSALQDVRNQTAIPEGFGVHEAEWDEEGYPEFQSIRSGRKYVDIPLPFAVWWPRAVSWAQGLSVFTHFMDIYGETGGESSDESNMES